MLTKIDYLLACISEECGEVVQAIGKSQRFGLDDFPFEGADRNFLQIQKEVHDLLATYEELCDELNEDSTINRVLITSKKTKLAKWAEYSRKKLRLH